MNYLFFYFKSISEQDLVNVVPRTQKSRFGFVKKPAELAGMTLNFHPLLLCLLISCKRRSTTYITSKTCCFITYKWCLEKGFISIIAEKHFVL